MMVHNGVLVSHFSKAENIGDCMGIKPYLTPILAVCFLGCSQNASVGCKIHNFTIGSSSDVSHHVGITKNSDRGLVVQQNQVFHTLILEELVL